MSFLQATMAVMLLVGAAEPQLGQPFELKPAQAVKIEGLQVTFDGVTEDSRCPTGVQCAWAGDASASFTLQTPSGPPAQRTLHTNGRFDQQADIADFIVRLEKLEPYPREGVATAPGDYRATLVVKRR
jgi:hypothetical protein